MAHPRRPYTVAVLGATGAVGREILAVLDERRFPVSELIAMASERSLGEELKLGHRCIGVRLTDPGAFAGVDLVLAAAGDTVARKLLPAAVEQGCVCVDTSGAFRGPGRVPLVVPELNPEAVAHHRGIIASPGGTTTQLVTVLGPLRDAGGLRRIVVSTYQAASGAGRRGMDELRDQTVALLNFRPYDVRVHRTRLAFNCVPQVGDFDAEGHSAEELALVRETRRLLGLPELGMSVTAVRVPVFAGHGLSIHVELERPLTPRRAREILGAAAGLRVIDRPDKGEYPTQMDCVEQDEVFVGRIRRDPGVEHGLALWSVADNLRKGAATNAVQIACLLDAWWTAAQA